MGLLTHSFALGLVAQDLTFYLTNWFITPAAGQVVLEFNQKLIKDVAPHTKLLIESFDVKEWMIHAPIASDWAAYNVHDNQGELITSRL